MILKKTDKNLVADWSFWLVHMNIIYRCVLSWYDMSTKGRMYKLVKRIFMGLHSDLHNVIASLAKIVSGSSNELRTNLSKSPIRFICNATYVTVLNIRYLSALFVC